MTCLASEKNTINFVTLYLLGLPNNRWNVSREWIRSALSPSFNFVETFNLSKPEQTDFIFGTVEQNPKLNQDQMTSSIFKRKMDRMIQPEDERVPVYAATPSGGLTTQGSIVNLD